MASRKPQDGEAEVDLDEALNTFEKKMERLKFLYDQYFQGFEKRSPMVLLKDVVRSMFELEQIDMRRTGPRFRFRSLVQRFNIYRTLWTRTQRQIELGTHKPHLLRMERKLKQEGVDVRLRAARTPAEVERALRAVAAAAAAAGDVDGAAVRDTAVDMSRYAGPTVVDAPAVRVPLPPRLAAPSPGPSSERVQAIFDEYVQAKLRNGEDVARVRFEALEQSLAKQVPTLVEKHGAKAVDFRVAVKDGKVVVQAVLKK